MKTIKFRHLSSFQLAGTEIPVRKLMPLLASKLLGNILRDLLKQENIEGLTLTGLSEPYIEKINYLEKTRGIVQQTWDHIIDNLSEIPHPQLLVKLGYSWSNAQKNIAIAKENAIDAFKERANAKAEVIEEEVSAISMEKGIPSAINWLNDRKKECEDARKALDDELNKIARRKQKQKEEIELNKEDWNNLLVEWSDSNDHNAPRNFLFLGGTILVVGSIIWFLNIPITSLIGIVTITVAALLGLNFARPVFREIIISKKLSRRAYKLATIYKFLSILELDEGLKGQEAEYYGVILKSLINDIENKAKTRMAYLEEKKEKVMKDNEEIEEKLYESLPTIRPLMTDNAVEKWYESGKNTTPITTSWKKVLVSLKEEPRWDDVYLQAEEVYSFLKNTKAEDELYLKYQEKQERMEFLNTLKEAAIGRTPGEAFLSLDISRSAQEPEVSLLVEIYDPEQSKLKEEIEEAWGNTAVGLSIVPGKNPSEITMVGLVYGFPLEAISESDIVKNSFDVVYVQEGESIYPVLTPSEVAKQ